jgi:hypothetical protein
MGIYLTVQIKHRNAESYKWTGIDVVGSAHVILCCHPAHVRPRDQMFYRPYDLAPKLLKELGFNLVFGYAQKRKIVRI